MALPPRILQVEALETRELLAAPPLGSLAVQVRPPNQAVTRIAPAPIYYAYPSSAVSDPRNRTFLDVDVGTISNGRAGEAANVTVSLRLRNGKTLVTDARADDRGRVRFSNLKLNERRAGRYQVTVRAQGYRAVVKDVPGYESFLNVTLRDQDRGPSVTPPPPAAPPRRTFVYLMPGFSTSSGRTGMHDLADALARHPSFASASVSIIPGALIGGAMLANARAFIERHQREAGATANDRVFLVGHSYGGEVARQLASDIRSHVAGAQPATALVTIEPIDYVKTMTSADFDQSDNPWMPAPVGVPASRILNIVQRSRGQIGNFLFGYRMTAGEYNDALGRGPDGRDGTRDDLTHTTIDSDPRVIQRVIDFLQGR
jgi:5-hydroxyisourate hydrolase-like protein (transthyretin family)/pimeloyl-ACP methyl ester carboxylesterase